MITLKKLKPAVILLRMLEQQSKQVNKRRVTLKAVEQRLQGNPCFFMEIVTVDTYYPRDRRYSRGISHT